MMLMDVNVAALTLLGLGVAFGFLLVVSFIEQPVMPLMTSPSDAAENEESLRGIHAFLQAFVSHGSASVLLPVVVMALVTSVIQAITRDYDVVSLFVSVGLFVLTLVTFVSVAPATRQLREVPAYESPFDTLSAALFQMVRLHHNMFLGVIPLMLAQLLLLFL